MRSIILCALGCALTPCAASAQTLVPTASISTPPTAEADTSLRFSFDIPALPLRDALIVFGRQAALRVEARNLAGETEVAPEVSGSFTAPHALRLLLAGSGNSARFRGAESVIVGRSGMRDSLPDALTPVLVTAEVVRRSGYTARRTFTATRTDVPLRDVPQAVTVLGRELLADQSMQSMSDVVRYIPGVTMGQGEGHRDAPTIRGNSSTADFFVDGVRDDAQYLRDLYNAERIEALKGSNAMIFGRGGGGGVINRVTKEAQWAPVRSLALEGGSFAHRRATLDAGNGLGSAMAGRVNAMFEDSRSFRNGAELERRAVNPKLAVLAGGTMVRLGYEYFADDRTVDRGVPSFQGRPSRADIGTFFGDPDVSRSRVYVNSADATVERGSTDGVMFRNRTRIAGYDKFYRNVYPGARSADGSEVSLAAYDNSTDRRNVFNQTDLSFAIGRGSVRQTLLVGAELGRQTTENYRSTGYFGGTATSLLVPFDRPTISAPVTFRQSATDADNAAIATVGSVYIQDQIALGSHVQAIAGLRHDRFLMEFTNHRGGQRLRRLDMMLSPRAGLVLKPSALLSFYGSVSVSHLPSSGDQFSQLTVTTQTLEPERFTNSEVGFKWELRPDLVVNGAAYHLDRTNTSTADPTQADRLVQTGRQRTTGLETEVVGNLGTRWQLAGGYSTQRARIVSRTSAAQPGARVPLVPAHTVSLWNRVRATERLGLALGVVHQADMFAAIDNTVTLPAFTRVDGALFLDLRRNLRLQANVENVFDARYYPTSHGNNNIMPGAPRTLRVSLTATP